MSRGVRLLGSAHAVGYRCVWRLPVNFTIDRNGLPADNGWEATQLGRRAPRTAVTLLLG